ncbi:hypothetical protein [Desulforamulus ruminis]|uniref:Uncharacterized protein n=1 Tax=Desulforamulus ruminis (strain ATCC 23193 / DSM 2154 / NCIMB 8452 / DL) TaxID=696281 RepID=F6DVC2_DESRL|nr:hypothetical protein [Desulforamulus ruminis]AEG60275.1 hypothetical protein Desru_2021 [Desulforamulus ruminis DSM 2154]
MEANTCFVALEKKEKLVKWYGWIVILFICMTPLVIVLLPKLMINVNRIHSLLKNSIVPETAVLEGQVTHYCWNRVNDGGLVSIEGEMTVTSKENKTVQCLYKKYVGPNWQQIPDFLPSHQLYLTGSFQDDGVFQIASARNLSTQQMYTTKPVVSVY